ncbi:MAG: hypothetical protein ACOC7U_01005 [Spirochaetota bacterium]
MPFLKKHIKLSLERTGKAHTEVHHWLDGRNVSIKEKIIRHKVSNIRRFLPVVIEKFGQEGAWEYLQHLRDDYQKDPILKLLRKLGKI